MFNLFRNCSSLTSVDLSNFDTSNIATLQDFFAYCKSLSSLDLSSFDTSKVARIGFMFNECINLEYIKFSTNFKILNRYGMKIFFKMLLIILLFLLELIMNI